MPVFQSHTIRFLHISRIRVWGSLIRQVSEHTLDNPDTGLAGGALACWHGSRSASITATSWPQTRSGMLSEVSAYYMAASYSVHDSPCKTILQSILLHRCRLALCLMSVCRRTPVRVLMSAHEPGKAKVIEHPSSLRLAICPTGAQYHERALILI